MDQHELLDVLKKAMVALDQEGVVSKTEMGLAEGISPLEIIQNGLMPGLNEIGELFENEEIFLPELMKSAKVFYC
jgi:methanogenic corrinoid protein MtbC1